MLKLLPFQRQAVRKINHHRGRALLADEMGLGKTIEALNWIGQDPVNRMPALVVCPACAKFVWEIEAQRHLNLRTYICTGKKPPQRNFMGGYRPTIIVINFEIMQSWLNCLSSIGAKTLIIDECFYIKSRVAKRTKAVLKFGKTVKQIIAISGTPLVSRPAELYTTLHLLRPDIFPTFFSFAFRYCKPRKRRWGWEFKGADHLDELHAILERTMMIRHRKADVLTELPPKTRHVIPLSLNNQGEYDEAKDNFLRWLATQASLRKVEQASKAVELTKMGYLKRLAAQLKMRGVFEWIDNTLQETDGKLVVFAIHKAVIQALRQRYYKQAVVIDGSTPPKQRKGNVTSFQNNPKIRMFIGNIQAAGTGITLTAANRLAFVEMDWVPANHTQAEDRIHRIGQKGATSIYYLVARDTIEEDLCKLVQRKQTIIEQTLDGTIDKDPLDVYTQLLRCIQRRVQ